RAGGQAAAGAGDRASLPPGPLQGEAQRSRRRAALLPGSGHARRSRRHVPAVRRGSRRRALRDQARRAARPRGLSARDSEGEGPRADRRGHGSRGPARGRRRAPALTSSLTRRSGSMFEHFDWIGAMQKSPVMIIILGASVLTLGFALERAIYFWKRRGD